ncbi:MAG TPA: NifU family protein [Vicinamibacteria bacterium]|nr:NifU family protein [Vicinamibacteria bacterium]
MNTIRITAEPKDANHCRFVVDRPVYPDGSVFFGTAETASGSPLAEKLFTIDGVQSVLIQDDVVTVAAATGGNWTPIAKQVGATIREVLTSGVNPVSDDVLDSIPDPETIKKKVQNILDREINPAVAAHGGWIELIDVQRNEVFIRMGGGCVGCGMADVTLKQGVERTIREAIPQVGAIMDTTDHASGRNPYYSPAK